jgi:hypothetical protein
LSTTLWKSLAGGEPAGALLQLAARLVCAGMVLLGSLGVLLGGGALILAPQAAYADGPVACGPSTQPPFPYEGFCADYNGDTTWYGTYGPGFPTAQGFGLCGDPPASGGDFPAPSYDYVAGGAPVGAGGDTNALGFAFSQGWAAGWWNGHTGQFTAAQAAAAAKLLYDTVVWGTPTPSMDPGVLAAYDDFDNWYLQARGMTDQPPQISAGLTSDSGSFTGSATDLVHLQFPGTDSPMIGQGVLLSITNGTFNSPTGPTTAGLSTDDNGNVLIPIFATNAAPVSIVIESISQVGLPGLDFFHPTTGELDAQFLAGFSPPTLLAATERLVSLGKPPPASGTVSVQKAGDDTAYYGLAGAVFDVEQGGTTVAALTTDAAGVTPDSGPLAVGTYTVHEQVPPPGYQVAPDQTVTVSANTNTVVPFTGTEEDHVTPATVTLHKVDAQSGQALAGAVFDVAYDPTNSGTYSDDLGTCTTGAAGTCGPAGNDGPSALLPGDYRVTEVSAPPGYYLNPNTATQTIVLTPGESGSVTFADFELGSLTLRKSGNDTAYESVEGAVFSVSGPAPSVGVIGTLTVGADGQSNTIGQLMPGTYTITETTPPPGYSAVAPVNVAVPASATTTVVDVMDTVIPATVSLVKVDAQTEAPLAGAVFDVAYDPADSGSYSDDLGTCTTATSGTCAPVGNDGPAELLPGNYQVTEVTPPPGYALSASARVQDITLTPGETGSVKFSDALLVAASFLKVASGNVNPLIVSLAGAQVVVHAGSATGGVVASCTTNAAGMCTTASSLLSGSTYCWSEVAPPAGLSGGAGGCFSAQNGQAAHPIVVDDAGLFVALGVKKVDAADPSVGLAGAVFDLYRQDGGHGPGTVPAVPPGAASIAGATFMARVTTGPGGTATFPLQYPGYAYCMVEEQAPANFVADGAPQCTAVLNGSTMMPPVVTSLTFSDSPQMVTLQAHKFNAAVPDVSIPGATYDLYTEGSAPPSLTPPVPPSDAASVPGDTWYARGTSNASGNLTFSVPAGYAWCLLEEAAPPDYTPDHALHCSSTLTTSSSVGADTIALPETVATVFVSAHKYDALEPSIVIAGATYALLVQGSMPAGVPAAATPAGLALPAGDTYWGQGTTNAAGLLSFAVPAGYAWCLRELVAPAGYQPDPDLHCTGVVTNQTSAAVASLALPEVPTPSGALAFTGGPSRWLPTGGVLLIIGGFGLLLIKRRLEGRSEGLLAGALVDGVDELAQPGEVPLVEAEGQPG